MLKYKKKNVKKQLTFNNYRQIWVDRLLNFELTIFDWSGLPFPQRNLEIILCINGIAALTSSRNIYECSFFGPTPHFLSYANVTLRDPLTAIVKKTAEVEPIFADTMGIGSWPRIEKYSSLLAHAEVTLQVALINYRKNGLLKASTDAEYKTITAWYDKLIEGEPGVILDSENLETLLSDNSGQIMTELSPGNATLADCTQCISNILRMYYAEIGIDVSPEKKERMIIDEVQQNEPMLKFNIDDMYKCRKDACRRINSRWGTNYDVRISLRKGDFDGDN